MEGVINITILIILSCLILLFIYIIKINQTETNLELCVEKDLVESNDSLIYKKGKEICLNGTKSILECTSKTDTLFIEKEWGKKFTINIENFPDKVYDGYSCTTPNYKDIIKPNLLIDLKYGPFMTNAYKYNLSTDKYKCDTEYSIDYDNGVILKNNESIINPNTNTRNYDFVNMNIPCFNEFDKNKFGVQLTSGRNSLNVFYKCVFKFPEFKGSFKPNKDNEYYFVDTTDITSLKLCKVNKGYMPKYIDFEDPDVITMINTLQDDEFFYYPHNNEYTSVLYFDDKHAYTEICSISNKIEKKDGYYYLFALAYDKSVIINTKIIRINLDGSTIPNYIINMYIPDETTDTYFNYKVNVKTPLIVCLQITVNGTKDITLKSYWPFSEGTIETKTIDYNEL